MEERNDGKEGRKEEKEGAKVETLRRKGRKEGK